MSSPKVTIIIPTFNCQIYIAHCLNSIFDQTYRDFQVLIVDNNSQDGTADFIRRNYPQANIIQNSKNLGFAKANNQGFRMTKTDFILLCNQDIILEPSWLEAMMHAADDERYLRYGSFGGRLLKLKSINIEVGDFEKTDKIDSCGLLVLKSHRVVELGAGEHRDKFLQRQEVFGQSGALALLRREALEKVMIKNEDHPNGDYFDGDFIFYKEDVDLAWRLQLSGWSSLLVPEAVAYHLRTLSGSEEDNIGRIIKSRSHKPHLAKYYSYRNHFLILFSDEFSANLLRYLPWIFWYELVKFFYILFFEPYSLLAIAKLLALSGRIRRKRKFIFSSARLGAKEISRWYK